MHENRLGSPVQSGGRLVQKENGRIAQQGEEERSPSALAAAESPDLCGFIKSEFRKEVFHAGRAIQYMEAGEIVFFAGGSGNPFFTTDTAVVLRAVETKADIILLAKNIDGVYTADPRKDPSATLIRDISYEEAEAKKLRVMDTAAFAMCAEQKVPQVRVFGLDDPENILKVLNGDPMGTVLHPAEQNRG